MIVWSKSAYADLKKAAAFFTERGSPELGRKIILYIGRAVERLARFPLTGGKGRVEGTRELPMLKIPYLMVYVPEKPHKIKIVRFLAIDDPRPVSLISPEQTE
jgi:addiction module RelE/StbE family toxin